MLKLLFYSSAGIKQADAAALAAGTYYVELDPGAFEVGALGAFQLMWDATVVATITWEATNNPELTTWAAAAGGWFTAPAPAPSDLSTLTIAGGSAGVGGRYAIGLPFGRLRGKAVVTTAGVLEAYENTKDG